VTEDTTSSTASSNAAKSRWASKIARRYQCQLSPELVDWFDREIWNLEGHGEYRQGVHPDELLAAAPSPIWPALMPCDFLPISGNIAGDWLCVRIAADNTASEVVQWYHGGGDWIPWGKSIAEALIFDALSVNLPGPSRRHADPAENPRLDSAPSATGDTLQPHACESAVSRWIGGDALADWAASQVAPEVAALLAGQNRGLPITDTLLAHGVSEIAVHCELIQASLQHPWLKLLHPKRASEWGVTWEEMVKWAFDIDQLPAERHRQLTQAGDHAPFAGQDWTRARAHAEAASRLDPQLAWPWEIIGYAAEREGQTEAALAAYLRASGCSVFSDQSVRLRTHWATARAAKFSVARMLELSPEAVASNDYLRVLSDEDPQRRRRAACDYWLTQAAQERAQGRFDEAHQAEMSAGWDLGAEPMGAFGNLLDSIARSAEQAGQKARAELARTHRNCLAARYRI